MSAQIRGCLAAFGRGEGSSYYSGFMMAVALERPGAEMRKKGEGALVLYREKFEAVKRDAVVGFAMGGNARVAEGVVTTE